MSDKVIKHKAVFLDRDGVINEDHGYTYRPENFDFIDGVFEACRRFMENGYLLVVVTNQSGIARGYYSEQDFEVLTDYMINEFKKQQVIINAVYHCPHHAKEGVGEFKVECDCRKPQPGMLLNAARDLNIMLSDSLMIGDKMSDMKAGRAAGVDKCILISDTEMDITSDEDAQLVDLVVPSVSDVRILSLFH